MKIYSNLKKIAKIKELRLVNLKKILRLIFQKKNY